MKEINEFERDKGMWKGMEQKGEGRNVIESHSQNQQ